MRILGKLSVDYLTVAMTSGPLRLRLPYLTVSFPNILSGLCVCMYHTLRQLPESHFILVFEKEILTFCTQSNS